MSFEFWVCLAYSLYISYLSLDRYRKAEKAANEDKVAMCNYFIFETALFTVASIVGITATFTLYLKDI